MSFEESLKQAGYHATQPRRTIYQLLDHTDVPMGISEIANESPTLDRSTVYRNIYLFEKLGIVKRVWFGMKSKYELSDQFQAHHHHVVCERCGRISKIDHTNLERMITRIAKKYDYVPTKHHVEIMGLCQDCQKLSETEQ